MDSVAIGAVGGATVGGIGGTLVGTHLAAKPLDRAIAKIEAEFAAPKVSRMGKSFSMAKFVTGGGFEGVINEAARGVRSDAYRMMAKSAFTGLKHVPLIIGGALGGAAVGATILGFAGAGVGSLVD